MEADYSHNDDEALRGSAIPPGEENPASVADPQNAAESTPAGNSPDLGPGEDFAKLMFDAAGALMVVLDRAGRVLALNRAACQLLGCTKDEVVGQLWFDAAVPAEQRAAQAAEFLAVVDSTADLPRRIVGPLQSRNGGLHDIDWQVTPWQRGQLNGCLAVGTEFTERLMNERKLRDSELRYRRLFESAKDGILILNAKTGSVVDVNPFLTELLGIPYTKLVGKAIWELGILKDVVTNKDRFLELQREEYIRYEDLPLETADGGHISAEFVSNVYTVDGDMVIQCNIRNVSARKKAEVALQRLHDELEQRVLDRTVELSDVNDALRSETVKRIRAEESELTAVAEERTRMAREIHDTLAQGLAGIIIQLQAAEETLTTEPPTAMSHVGKAKQLAVDSLTNARRSMWALRPQMLEKGDLVYAISTFVDNLSADSPILFEFHYQGQRTRLDREVEEGVLRICQEALMNAGKHSQAPVVRTLLSFADDLVTLTVDDEGRGFAVNSTPFMHGLGLRIMKERATALGGTFTLASEPGKGTRVSIQVPAASRSEDGS